MRPVDLARLFFLSGTQTLTLVTAAMLMPAVGVSQSLPGHGSSGRISVGSKWSRSHGAPRSGITRRTNARPGIRASGGQPRFFGGVTVGRGFYPYYYPGYYGNRRYGYVGPLYPLSYGFGAAGFHVSIESARFGSLYRGIGQVLPPYYYYGGYYGYPSLPPMNPRTPAGFGANRAPVSRSRVNHAPRVEFGPTFGQPLVPALQGQVDFASLKRRVEAAINREPFAGEFAAAATDHRRVTSIDRIESQRLQTEGDRALRNADAELARTFYQAAVRAAPARRQPWIRLAWVHVVQREYARASAAFNRALLIQSDSGSLGPHADELLHNTSEDRSWLSDAGLLNWLQERPGSADRLLLAAGYEFFLSQVQKASELRELALAAGISLTSYHSLGTLASNRRNGTHRGATEEATATPQDSGIGAPDQVSATPPPGPGELILPPATGRLGEQTPSPTPSQADSAGGNEVPPALRLPPTGSE